MAVPLKAWQRAVVTIGFVVCFVVSCVVVACAPAESATKSGSASEVPEGIDELADGKLEVIVFPMVDEPFVAPNLAAGVLAMRGGVDRFMGIDIDIMAAFAADLGVDVEFVRLESPGFGDLIPALVAGEGDMIASALTINDERDKIIDFSRSYFTVSIVIVTRTGAGIEGPADLAGKIGVGVAGGLPFEAVKAAGFEGELIEAEFQTGAYADVSDGYADFAIMESGSARSGIASRPGLEIAFAFPQQDHYGFAAREGSPLVELINPFLDELESSGELERILVKHLGPDPLQR